MTGLMQIVYGFHFVMNDLCYLSYKGVKYAQNLHQTSHDGEKSAYNLFQTRYDGYKSV